VSAMRRIAEHARKASLSDMSGLSLPSFASCRHDSLTGL
jgi:hypothetical protein